MWRHASSHADDQSPPQRQQGARREARGDHREGLAAAMTRAARNRSNAARVAHMTRRLVALHAETTAADLAAGIAWYDRAKAAAAGMAVDGQTDRAAAVIAHLSPRNPWAKNVGDAARVLTAASEGDDCPAVHTGKQRAKAWAVATGTADPAAAHGPKTDAFFANIMGDSQRVCVDVWAVRAATGDHDAANPTRSNYHLYELAYQRAAAIVGMAPRDLQAAIWVHIRGKAD